MLVGYTRVSTQDQNPALLFYTSSRLETNS